MAKWRKNETILNKLSYEGFYKCLTAGTWALGILVFKTLVKNMVHFFANSPTPFFDF